MFENEMMRLLLCDLLTQLVQSPRFNLLKLNALSSMLYQAGIPFDTKFTPGTRRDSAGVELTIYIRPTVTMVYNISFSSNPVKPANENDE